MTREDRLANQLYLARKLFTLFSSAVFPSLKLTPFHEIYYRVLHRFATGEIKKLIITVPPQHGKSQGSTRLLPAYMLGLNPENRIAIASYSASLANNFNRDVQRVMDSWMYGILFPETRLRGSSRKEAVYIRTADEFNVVGHSGGLKTVGVGGGITGRQVDTFFFDDLYKDAVEANSPVTRERVISWYNTVAETRLHNDSQQLMVFTRWHEEDLIGYLLGTGDYREITSLNDISSDFKGWYYLNFEAIKDGIPTDIDPRANGTPLWGERHSREKLLASRARDPHYFECLYQGHPSAREGLLYGDNFQVYENIPADDQIVFRGNYTDTADMGSDYLCSVCYVKSKDGKIDVTDVLYTQEPMEVTESATAEMLQRNDTRMARIESNNGGRGFSRNIQRLVPSVRVEWFHQSGNKESRVLTNAATVLSNIRMPKDWAARWPEFYHHLTTFKRVFSANKNDDAPDTLTGIVEKEIQIKSNFNIHFI